MQDRPAAAGARGWIVEFMLLAAIWGSSFLFMRLGAVEFGPLPTAAVRVGVAAAFLLPLVWVRGLGPQLRRHWKPVFLIGVFNSGIPFACFAFAVLSITTGLSAILNATVPLFGAVALRRSSSERVAQRRAAKERHQPHIARLDVVTGPREPRPRASIRHDHPHAMLPQRRDRGPDRKPGWVPSATVVSAGPYAVCRCGGTGTARRRPYIQVQAILGLGRRAEHHVGIQRQLHAAVAERRGLAHALPRPHRLRRLPAQRADRRRGERNSPAVGEELVCGGDFASNVGRFLRALAVKLHACADIAGDADADDGMATATRP